MSSPICLSFLAYLFSFRALSNKKKVLLPFPPTSYGISTIHLPGIHLFGQTCCHSTGIEEELCLWVFVGHVFLFFPVYCRQLTIYYTIFLVSALPYFNEFFFINAISSDNWISPKLWPGFWKHIEKSEIGREKRADLTGNGKILAPKLVREKAGYSEIWKSGRLCAAKDIMGFSSQKRTQKPDPLPTWWRIKRKHSDLTQQTDQ